MAYTILIQNKDNSAIATEREALIQNSKLVDVLKFIVPKEYNGYEMSEFDFYIEYQTPISHSVKIETLTIADANYKDDYILYQLDVDTDITHEAGDIEMNLYFSKVTLDADGNTIEQVRKIQPIVITIVPVSSFFTAPDAALDQLVQLYIQNQKNIAATQQLALSLNDTKADDIKLDVENGYIYLLCNGNKIGTGIALEELSNNVTESAGSSEGNISIQFI